MPLIVENRKSKKIIILCISLLVICGVGTGYFYIRYLNKTNLTKNTVCEKEIIQAAKSAFETDSGKELRELGSRVKALKHYDKDVNCMYIVLRYDLRYSQLDDVKKSLTAFKAIYNSDVLLKSFGAQSKDFDELNDMVAFREKQQTSVQQSMKIINETQSER